MIPKKKTEIEHQITKLLSLSWGVFLAPFLYQSSISRSGQCDNNFVIWCSNSVFFSGIKNSASFLDTWKIWEKSKKLCRFKNWHQIEDQRERILIVPSLKNSYFSLERDIKLVFAQISWDKPILAKCQVSGRSDFFNPVKKSF